MSEDELPLDGRSDADLAALIARYDPCDAATAQRTLDVLAPLIRDIAARVSANWSGSRREDFLDDVVADLFVQADGAPLIRRYDPTRGSVVGWLFAVVRNMWRSRTRGKACRKRAAPFDEHLWSDRRPDWRAIEASFGRVFSTVEMSIIDRWDTRERVEVLCMAGLEHRVPTDRWERYLGEYEAATGRTLARPFPPADVSLMSSPGPRTRPLAALLGVEKPNTLSKRWERGRGRLLELPSVGDLFTAATDSSGDLP